MSWLDWLLVIVIGVPLMNVAVTFWEATAREIREEGHALVRLILARRAGQGLGVEPLSNEELSHDDGAVHSDWRGDRALHRQVSGLDFPEAIHAAEGSGR